MRWIPPMMISCNKFRKSGPFGGRFLFLKCLLRIESTILLCERIWGFRLRAEMEMVSPCGATYFARVGKVGKAPPGAAHGHLQCPIPPRPGPPFILRRSHQGALYLHPARAKVRTPFLAPPAAAPCCLNRYLLLQERSRLAPIPRGAVRCSLRLSGWCQICKTAVNMYWF